ncbi:MAG: hypothetical protein K2W91_02630 [Novosphingobium sp.]|nr:hypothetical protein [Novosphingobium sp.]
MAWVAAQEIPLENPPTKEEQRHHLKKPGQPLRPGQDPQQVPANHRTVLHIGRGDQPVPHHHRQDRQRAQEIDIAIAFRRRLARHFRRTCP